MPAQHAMRRKLVSHRARGFAPVENSAPALRAACEAGVPRIEIDTRVSADGVLFVFHNPALRCRRGRVRISEMSSGELMRHSVRREPLLRLADALDLVRRCSAGDTRLMIDIKDYGFEEQHLELVARAGLEAVVEFVSWIPQTLLRLAELGARGPLVFSHINVLGRRVKGRRLWAAAAHRVRGDLVSLGPDDVTKPVGWWGVGHTPHVTCAIVPEPLSRTLAAAGGGVCVAARDAGPRLATFCRSAGLTLAVYSARTVPEYMELAAQDEFDFVFSDDAPRVLEALR